MSGLYEDRLTNSSQRTPSVRVLGMIRITPMNSIDMISDVFEMTLIELYHSEQNSFS